MTAFNGALENPVNGAAPLAFGESTGQLEVPAGDYEAVNACAVTLTAAPPVP